MSAVNFTIALGDSKILSIPLVKDGIPFAPDMATGALIFTAKRSYADADEDSVFQKSSTAGITLAGMTALVRVLREDTADLEPCDLYIEVLWQDTVTLLAEPVAGGGLKLRRRLTRGQQTAVPVVTTEIPLPFGSEVGGGVQDSFATVRNPDGGIDLTLYNWTTGAFRRVSITGSGPSERIVFSDP